MAVMPGADYRPLPQHGGPMTGHDIACLHTMVGSLWGTDAYFRTGAANSQFGTGGLGELVQWLDTRIQSWANYDGNPNVIALENADMGPGFAPWNTGDASQVPPFTDAQAETIARWLAWVCSPAAHADCPPSWTCHREGIPLEAIPDSRPGRRGVGYHRQGVPGYMAADRVKWSKRYKKACPGDRRIAQIPSIVARARQIVAGATALIDPEGPEMRVLRVKETGRMYTATDLEVAYISDPTVAAAAVLAWGEVKEVSQRQVDLLAFDANARRARSRVETIAGLASQVTGADVDEQAIGRAVVEGVTPALVAALAGRSGLTREDVEQVVRGVFADAAATS